MGALRGAVRALPAPHPSVSCLVVLWVSVGAAVPLLGGEPDCGLDKYKPDGLEWCCKKCPAGSHVSRHCGANHGVPLCSQCEPGTFLAYQNGQTSCQPCTTCRADQEVVAACTQTSDQQCQCKTGSFYCDSLNCVENCLRCRRCAGAVIRPCNATHDTVCDSDAGADTPGKQTPKDVSVHGFKIVIVVLGIFLCIIITIVLFYVFLYCRKRKGLWPRWCFISFWRGRAGGPDSTTCPRHSESLVPLNSENEQPAADMEASSPGARLENEGLASTPTAAPRPAPSEEPMQGAVGGSPAMPQQALQSADPMAPGAPSLRTLEQEYEAKYFVRDLSREARIYYKFERSISDKDWKPFMRFLGLEDSDIDNCESQYPSDVMEQHHQMLRVWRNGTGKGASVFSLLAALHKMQLRMYLENIINWLLDEGLLGRRAETSD
ncbi:tumor necrosis factor receptor superfamily member 1A-like [Enhydra lutris kenyoni]|uniref:Tumor necrosis factor receptor superfamily member 1A-like n=1 Tax=Enhydra lutris kenyoni TaxID=391180 RepID=A0A2Y9JPX7_ENHLU|nr:tumor necrosis factor receptor superfamily member 1A-like [Enhydra lutris kenyoni]